MFELNPILSSCRFKSVLSSINPTTCVFSTLPKLILPLFSIDHWALCWHSNNWHIHNLVHPELLPRYQPHEWQPHCSDIQPICQVGSVLNLQGFCRCTLYSRHSCVHIRSWSMRVFPKHQSEVQDTLPLCAGHNWNVQLLECPVRRIKPSDYATLGKAMASFGHGHLPRIASLDLINPIPCKCVWNCPSWNEWVASGFSCCFPGDHHRRDSQVFGDKLIMAGFKYFIPKRLLRGSQSRHCSHKDDDHLDPKWCQCAKVKGVWLCFI